MTTGDEALSDLHIAIIGFAGRFPGARDCDEFWDNLLAGRDCISRFSRDALLQAGAASEAIDDPAFVAAGGVVQDADLFDAPFFGFSPREAEVLDPQQRMFLQCAWHALEDAGYDPHRCAEAIGVFAGVALNTYLLNHIQPNRDRVASMDDFQIMILNDKDTLPTRLAYKLNLRGPAVNVQTSCSTGLVAVHFACNSLLNFECDMALAGAMAIKFPQVAGYRFHPGGILSVDGRCCAFDQSASGTVGGAGGGVVVLKRLAEAIADGDAIRAIVRGSAINNDGSRKVSYTAPSVDGQAEVIAAAHARARVSPDTISYVEAHGTATPMGDPIEVTALATAFRDGTTRTGFCGLGSVKTNIGHLDTAAGIAGIIKTTLALQHHQLPPSLHCAQPSSALGLERTPFYINTVLQPWPANGSPRRAGVSSFGVGGTNAHVVLEEAPSAPATRPSPRSAEILTWSGHTLAAADTLGDRISLRLSNGVDRSTLADAAFTLHLGRAELQYRQALVCRRADDLQRRSDRRVMTSGRPVTSDRPIVFLFPGQGSQRPGTISANYAAESTFREWIDRGAALAEAALGFDIRALLLAHRDDVGAARLLQQTQVAQPALVIVEHALARLWMAWGAQPSAVLGHSIGEYAAASISGILSFEDALHLALNRGAIVSSQPAGGMTAIDCPSDTLMPLLPHTLVIAAVNAPDQCVVGGPLDVLRAFEALLDRHGLAHVRLRTSHAFHSPMMQSAVEPFARIVAGVQLHEPRVAMVSSVTGGWLTHDVVSADYWATHLTAPVRFAEAIAQVAREQGGAIWLETGLGRALTTLARRQLSHDEHVFIGVDPDGCEDDGIATLEALARLWVEGASIDWRAFHLGEQRRRIRLPLYPFEERRYFIDAPTVQPPRPRSRVAAIEKQPMDHWFHELVWAHAAPIAGGVRHPAAVLLFTDATGFGDRLAAALAEIGARVTCVTQATDLAGPTTELAAAHERQHARVDTIVYAWPLDVRFSHLDASTFDETQRAVLFPLFSELRALGRIARTSPLRLVILTQQAQPATDVSASAPTLSPLLAVAKVIPQEMANIECVAIDIDSGSSSADASVRAVVREILAETPPPLVALRGESRWLPTFRRLSVPEPRRSMAAALRPSGVYLILGGLGHFGLELAALLAEADRPSIIIADSRAPDHAADMALRELRDRGARVQTRRVDVADVDALGGVIQSILKEHGHLHGVVHAAGCPELLTSIDDSTPDVFEQHFVAKVRGTLALEQALGDRDCDFVWLVSSLASVLGGLGLAAYAAANAFLDAFAQSRRGSRQNWVSLNLESWVVDTATSPTPDLPGASRIQLAMTRHETTDVLRRLLVREGPPPQVMVSTGDLDARLSAWVRPSTTPVTRSPGHARPELTVPYAAPQSPTERIVAEIWADILGVDQIGVDDSFFELGGDSLTATRAVARIRERFQMDLPLRALFETPTISAISRALDRPHGRAATEAEIESLLAEIESESVEQKRSQPQPVAVTAAESPRAPRDPAGNDLAFSLFFFAGDGASDAVDKYRLVLEAAQFADRNDFEAVWIPERHFHPFGGIYPNPSVLAAALAATTRRVLIRAGSVVLPLHHPVRVVEEWSMLDNLSGGRVGVSFASGWVPEDFVLASTSFEQRRETMFERLDTVRRLWRGERVSFPLSPDVDPVSLRIFPAPIQPELPVWLTTAGSRETWVQAGRRGLNVLTGLLQGSLLQIAENIAAYRAARAAAGHDPEAGRITLMLHTFVGPDEATVRAQVREPLMAYLRGHVGMYEMQKLAGERLSIDVARFSDDDKEALVEHAFERYVRDSGLFGTPQSCRAQVDRIREIGVTEVGCLIDYGIAREVVVDSLAFLARLRDASSTAESPVSVSSHGDG
jgi:natural product biosynthesis luciferase-like monooxygenase protein